MERRMLFEGVFGKCDSALQRWTIRILVAVIILVAGILIGVWWNEYLARQDWEEILRQEKEIETRPRILPIPIPRPDWVPPDPPKRSKEVVV